MARPTKIHHGKQPHRFHYIPEWAARRGLRQSQIARELDTDKSTVKRWFDGTIPTGNYLLALAGLLVGPDEEPAALFRHPDDDWLRRVLSGRTNDERQRILQTIETAFPRRVA